MPVYLRTEISVVMGRNQMLQAGWSGKLLRGRALELIAEQTSRGSQAGKASLKVNQGFPGGAVVGSPPANAGDTGSHPGLGGSRMPRSSWAREPQLLSLRVWSLCSAAGEAAVVRGPRTAMRDFGSLFDLENDLPDELIPNGGELGLLNSGNLVPDAASKHKQLSELLRGGSSSSINPGIGNVSASSPVQQGLGGQAQGQPNSANMASLGAMGKSPLNQGDSSAPSLPKQAASTSGPTPPASQALNPQAQKQVGLVTSSPATSQTGPGICMNANFNQTHPGLLNSNSGHSLMNPAQQGQAQVMNGSLGAAGRGRGAGIPYATPAMQGAASSVLAETLTQVSPQMASHAGLNTAQAGGMSK
ncbi:hypothetical protein J1605_006079, partial [Eschrichtius robustus]